MRILVVHPRDPAAPTVGGIQTFLLDLIKYAPADFELTIAGTTADRRARPIGRIATVTVDGHAVRVLPLAPSGGLPRDPLGLLGVLVAQLRLRLMMVGGGSILQVHRPYRPYFLMGQRGPRVQFIHVDIRDWPGPTAWHQVRSLYRAFSSTALESMSHVFVVNEPGAEIIRRDHPRIADRVDFLPVWYDPHTFFPANGHEQVGTDLPVVLFAGRLDEIKDPQLALDGFAELLRRGRAARLVVYGTGNLRQPLAARVHALGLDASVQLMGDVPREQLAGAMRAADVLLLTSTAEGGGPRVVVESLASGVPVVATAVGEVRRTVAHQVNGWLIADRTAGAVADGLEWVLAQPRGALSAAATEAARPYTAPVVLERVFSVYRDLAAKAAR